MVDCQSWDEWDKYEIEDIGYRILSLRNYIIMMHCNWDIYASYISLYTPVTNLLKATHLRSPLPSHKPGEMFLSIWYPNVLHLIHNSLLPILSFTLRFLPVPKELCENLTNQHNQSKGHQTVKSNTTVPAEPNNHGKFNIKYSLSVIANKMLAENETFPNVENIKNNKLNPSVLFNLQLRYICGILALKYNTAETYPRILGPRSSVEADGVSLSPRGWFSEDNAQPRIPAAMTRNSAPTYCRTILRRVEGGDSAKEVRRGRRGVDSDVVWLERTEERLSFSGCLRKYSTWNMRTESARMK